MRSTPSRPMLRGLAALVAAAALTACSPATGAPPDGGAGAGAPDTGPPLAAPPTPAAAGGRIPAGSRPATVTTITDGDTIRVAVGGVDEPVRLLEVDAPEIDGGCGADHAVAFVRRRVPVGSIVWLERDVSDRDRYGRLLRYVWTADGQLLNAAIVRAGWARAKLYPPDDGRWAQVQRAERRARRAGRGIWRRCEVAPAPTRHGQPASSSMARRMRSVETRRAVPSDCANSPTRSSSISHGISSTSA